MLGLSAAFGGTLVERNGPRWAMFVSLVCFSSGFLISALGVATGQYWLVVLGYGFVGGIGLGIGYISPVSTLIKWFPDRPGMATGIAIMGFGGGALIASPWSTGCSRRSAPTARGIAADLPGARARLRGLHVARRAAGPGAAGRLAARGLGPGAGRRPPLVTTADVSARNAIRTPQFWCLWVVLCMNVTAGIGILEKAAPMITDFFADTSSPGLGLRGGGLRRPAVAWPTWPAGSSGRRPPT